MPYFSIFLLENIKRKNYVALIKISRPEEYIIKGMDPFVLKVSMLTNTIS